MTNKEESVDIKCFVGDSKDHYFISGKLAKENGRYYGFLYKSPSFFDELFRQNTGFVLMSCDGDGDYNIKKGLVCCDLEKNGGVIILGSFYSNNKNVFLSIFRKEWAAKMLVEKKSPVINFYIDIKEGG